MRPFSISKILPSVVRSAVVGTLCAAFAILAALPAQAKDVYNIILIHGMWALPESLAVLGKHVEGMGYHVYFVDYETPETCQGLAHDVREHVEEVIKEHGLDRSHTYAYGYSLGGMALASSRLKMQGIIIDAPANYPEEACVDLKSFFPDGKKYPSRVLEWRHNSDNRSPSVKTLMESKSRVLIIGHEQDELIPQTTIMAYANAPQASVWWVPGTHEPDWMEVAHIVHRFVSMDGKIGTTIK